jgi:hypothetical protein
VTLAFLPGEPNRIVREISLFVFFFFSFFFLFLRRLYGAEISLAAIRSELPAAVEKSARSTKGVRQSGASR